VNNDVQDTIKKLKGFLEKLHEDAASSSPKSPAKSPGTNKDYLYYANIVNPETDKPYIIPMLSLTDPDYTNKYVEYMKVLENQPDMFKKILNWD